MNTEATTPNRKYVEITGGRKHEFAIHGAHCRDIKKALREAGVGGRKFEAPNPQVFIDGEVEHYEYQGQGWNHDHFHVHGCCENAPFVEPVEAPVAEAPEVEAPAVEDARAAFIEAAQAELARRKHNKLVKKTGEGVRIEAASEWAFKASTEELRNLATA